MSDTPGVVEADRCYTLEEFQRVVGLGRDGIRAARRAGLVVRRAHRRGYVLGRDWIMYLTNRGEAN